MRHQKSSENTIKKLIFPILKFRSRKIRENPSTRENARKIYFQFRTSQVGKKRTKKKTTSNVVARGARKVVPISSFFVFLVAYLSVN